MRQTITSIQDKSPEELNVICAELCGVDPESHWWCPTCKCDVAPSHVTYEETHDVCFSMVEIRDAPPYATSYDAIMPEVTRLDGRQREDFCKQLEKITKPKWDETGRSGIGISWVIDWCLITASPADLTRALIVTLQTNEETK